MIEGQQKFVVADNNNNNSNQKSKHQANIVGYLTAGSLFKKDRKFTFQKTGKNLNIPQQKITNRLTFNSQKVQAKYSDKPYLTQRVRHNNNYFDDSFKITEFTNTQNTLFNGNNNSEKIQKDDSLSKYQHKIVQPNFRKLNLDLKNENILNQFQRVSPNRTNRKDKKSPQKIADLQTSRRRYFQSCRQEAERYLNILQAELKESESNIKKVQTQVRSQIKQEINQRSLQLKEVMVKMIDEFIQEWKISEIQFYRVNQMKFLGDAKQLLAQIEQRHKLLQEFNVKLQFQSQQNWKKVTAQLLYFDYDTTIKQIHRMSQNMLNTVHQKYNMALNIKHYKQQQKGHIYSLQDLSKAKKQLLKIFEQKNILVRESSPERQKQKSQKNRKQHQYQNTKEYLSVNQQKLQNERNLKVTFEKGQTQMD